jgi:hypothetical protein
LFSFFHRNELETKLQAQKEFYINELICRDQMVKEMEVISKENLVLHMETRNELENVRVMYENQQEMQLTELQNTVQSKISNFSNEFQQSKQDIQRLLSGNKEFILSSCQKAVVESLMKQKQFFENQLQAILTKQASDFESKLLSLK